MADDGRDSGADALRAAIQAIPGVEHIAIDTQTREACLILRADVDPEHTAQLVNAAAGEYTVHLAYRPEHRDRQRVRFVELSREDKPDRQVAYRVTLEWAGNEHHGTAMGERGPGVELRTIAAASLEALGMVVPGGLPIKLAGVKQVRAFDAELVVVSLYRPDAQPHNLVGAVVSGGDSNRAAAICVLSALNRLMGNYLLLP